jgi:TetR/AcrR family transcriptional regulator, transcriptional repressor for nem operon
MRLSVTITKCIDDGYNYWSQASVTSARKIETGSTMKISKAASARNRAALLNAASELFRERGFEGVSIADIAAAAGLTHGAFYNHFTSKEALCAEVVEQAIGKLAARVKTTNRRVRVEGYLSAGHVENRAEGCPLAALSGDVAREGRKVRAAFSHALDGLIDALAQEEAVEGAPARDRAIVGMATRLGALALARAATDPKLRDEILAAAKRALLDPPSR